MVYVFTSVAGPRVTYLGAVGDAILRHAGKTPGPRGVIEASDIDTVLERLADAVAREAAAETVTAGAPTGVADADSDPSDAPPAVSLALRIGPFVDLLRRAQADGKDVTWGI